MKSYEELIADNAKLQEAYDSMFRDLQKRTEQVRILSTENEHLSEAVARIAKERDAAIRDLTEFATFYKIMTICHFCKYENDDDPSCGGRNNHKDLINKCFEWKGIEYD